MSDSYKYIDFDYTYVDPKTGILKNIPGITDPDVLLFVESGAVTKRLQELYNNPIKIKGVENLFDIHKHLFQDIYFWAGKKRIVEISKDGKQFFPTTHFDNASNYINSRIVSVNATKVKFRWKDYRDNRTKIMDLPCAEFIRRFLQHSLSRAPGYFPTAFTR